MSSIKSTKSNVQYRDMSRRAFVAGAAGVAGMAAIAAGATSARASEAESWDAETDVLVLGAGGAGMRAAYTAKDAGCDVLVLEKGEDFGGTSMLSAGIIQAAGTHTQADNGVEDSVEDMEKFYMTLGEGWVEEDLINDMCEHSAEHIEFLESLGLDFVNLTSVAHTPFTDAAGISPVKRIHGTEGGSKEVFTTLHDAAEALGVTFQYNTEATELLLDSDGNVEGVVATDADGKEIRVHALRGVIVATGGIDRSEELSKRLNQQQYWDLERHGSLVNQYNTGDGIRMGLAIGAQGRNFGGTVDMTSITRGGINAETPIANCIYVNGEGKRFVCEDYTYAYTARAVYQQTVQLGHDCYTIIGASGFPIVTNRTEIAVEDMDKMVEDGDAFKADTIEDLAAQIDVDPDNLTATIETWNEDMASGEDKQFGRVTGLGAIEAPYYAFWEGAGNMGSIGGLEINTNAQVLDTNGEPIPHLYAAGIASAGWMGPFYPGSGTSLLGGQHWGWRAGQNAAAETPLA
jgi:urocanate reductase